MARLLNHILLIYLIWKSMVPILRRHMKPGIDFLQKDRETVETEVDFIWAPKSLQMVTAAMKEKVAYSLEEKLCLT